MKKLVSMTLATFISFSSVAGSVGGDKIVSLMQDKQYGNKVFIELHKSLSSPASCHDSSRWAFALDTSTELGKQMYSSLLTLYASQKSATFYGTNSCSLHDKIEELRRIELQ